MPDDKERKGFEEASKPIEPASLRVVPIGDPWTRAEWLPTGEAVVGIFKQREGGDYCWLEAGHWLHWTGELWQRDQVFLVERSAAALCREIGASKKKGFRTKLESANFISGMVRRLKAELAAPFDQFDCGDILNTPGGTIPLAGNGATEWSIREHLREDYCTKICAVTPVRSPCPQWMAFVRRVMGDDADLVDFLQRLIGYCITRSTAEQIFCMFFGPGQSGKGTFLRVIKRLLGSYAMVASLDLFLSTKYEAHPEELAALPGIRFVIANETEQGRAWNESKIKTLSGGDAIRARRMRQDSFEFQPCAKIIISGNHAPILRHVDSAMRRRLIIVPFSVAIPDSERDNELENRLVAQEGPQILAWVLDGLIEYRKFGLATPDRVVGESAEYFETQDLKAQWIAECTEQSVDGMAYTLSLFHSWKTFSEKGGERAGSIRSFVADMRNRGFTHDHARNGNVFRGLRLRMDNPVDDPML